MRIEGPIKWLAIFFISLFSLTGQAQSGYKITCNMKNCADTLAYLTYYQMDKTYIKDTCTTIKNGKIVFEGKEKLQNGIYSLVNQKKAIVFDFFVDENTQNLILAGDYNTLRREATAENSPQQNEFFKYTKFLTDENEKFALARLEVKGLSKKDSIAKLVSLKEKLDKSLHEYESAALEKNKGSYFGSFLSLKIEKTLNDVPKASNGRPDSLKVYNFYKKHYWEGVDFKDEAIMRNPFFYYKLKGYYENVIVKHPDSVIVEIDKMLAQPPQESLLFKLLLAHFTGTYETYNIMGFDKVFVHMVDTYIKKGKAIGTYEEDVIEKIIKRSDKLKPLLIDAVAPNLFMIKASDRDKMVSMGFEKANSSEEVTKIFYNNVNEITKLFYKLHDVTADYLVLIFYDVDCGHCQKEIPKLQDLYHNMQKEKKDIKVFAVYTEKEGDKYLKYIDEKKLDWINVYDGAFYNNVREKYDVYSTPVIYILDKNKKIKAKRVAVEQIKDIVAAMEEEYRKSK